MNNQELKQVILKDLQSLQDIHKAKDSSYSEAYVRAIDAAIVMIEANFNIAEVLNEE